ncbi:MAG: class I SAM-dependent methyltransferase [Deltaproteobacteria bacterium]|nr:class I SAM-dependent methyltransferase [Deltaproteobacteria bacterium]MBW2401034.1 class I SAM-dependent methyltransferase [Deltaproteobacteria bacterium]
MADSLSNSLRSDPTRSTLERLHAAARRERFKFLTLAPRFIVGKLQGKSFSQIVTPAAMKDFFIPISPEQGRFVYLVARTLGARNIVEFGTSFGISTLYLAAAVKDNGGGQVIGTEIEASKHARALAHIEEAGLAGFVDVRLGDALETLQNIPDSVDMVLIDGWKDLYLPVLKLLEPSLRPGAVVLADNIFTFKRDLEPYVDYVQSGRNGFESTTLEISDGFEYSVRLNPL